MNTENKNGNEEKSEREEASDTLEERLMPGGGAVFTEGKASPVHCLNIIGQIEGHYLLGETQKTTKYEHVIPLLVAIEESKENDGLLVILNTMGGDVEAGLAIAEMIASMKKPTVSLVLGGSHSIGVPLAVAAKRSFIAPSATMTLHPVRINGLVIGAPQTYNYFRDMQNRIVKFITDNSKAHADELDRLMMKPDEMANDIGSVLDGEQAVKHGLIDEVGGLDRALAALHEMIKSSRQV